MLLTWWRILLRRRTKFALSKGKPRRPVCRLTVEGLESRTLLSTMHPTTLRLYNTYKDGGWRPKIPYFSDKPVPYASEWDMTWTWGRKRVDGYGRASAYGAQAKLRRSPVFCHWTLGEHASKDASGLPLGSAAHSPCLPRGALVYFSR